MTRDDRKLLVQKVRRMESLSSSKTYRFFFRAKGGKEGLFSIPPRRVERRDTRKKKEANGREMLKKRTFGLGEKGACWTEWTLNGRTEWTE